MSEDSSRTGTARRRRRTAYLYMARRARPSPYLSSQTRAMVEEP
jgi:hypothetical protein